MKSASLLVFLAVAASSTTVFACLWLQGTSIDGHFGPYASPELSPKNLGAFIPKLARDHDPLFGEKVYNPRDDAAKANDKAVQTLLRGDTAKAIAMLEETELKHPDVYFTAANLGTAYELAGQDEKALEWILKGIKRNPSSHMRTEWLHVRILEAKVALKKDPTWLTTHTITGADYLKLNDDDYRLKTEQGELYGRDVQESLFRQLSVRMLLVKPPDPIVSQLLKELAIAESQLGALEYADEYAKFAVRYGMPAAEMQETVMKWRRIIKDARK